MEQLVDLFRWCNDIDMYASDRPINDVGDVEGSCVHRSRFCDDTCFNIKLYRMYPNMGKRDQRCEKEWQALNPSNMQRLVPLSFKRKRKQKKRIRLQTRGEAFKDATDVYKVKAMVLSMPDTIWWIPTKAWRDASLKFLIEAEIMPLKNVALNASTDPDTSPQQWEDLHKAGWNIMFYGNDALENDPVTGNAMFDCPKTGKGIKGHCSICKAGCFSQTTNVNRRVTVKLHQH